MWQYLGGDLVLGKVFLDGKQTEHHYWNRIDGEDLDLTRQQFQNGENIVEANVLPNDFLKKYMSAMKPEVLSRITIMSEKVSRRLGETPQVENAETVTAG